MNKNIYYKIYGIFIFLVATLNCGYLIKLVSMLNSNRIKNLSEILDIKEYLVYITTGLMITGIIIIIVALFELFASFTFSKVLDNKKGFIMPSGLFSNYATIVIFVWFISTIAMIVGSFILSSYFNFLPPVTLIITFLGSLYIYINIYARHKCLADVIDNDRNNKNDFFRLHCTDNMRGYGIFSLIFLSIIGAINVAEIITIFIKLKDIVNLEIFGDIIDSKYIILLIINTLSIFATAYINYRYFNDMKKIADNN